MMMYEKYTIICTCLCLWYISPGQAHTMATAVRPVVETPDSTATSSTPETADTTAIRPTTETPVSTAVSTSSKPKLDHTVDFNPLDYLYSDRYVEKGDTFRNRFLDHLLRRIHDRLLASSPKRPAGHEERDTFRWRGWV